MIKLKRLVRTLMHQLNEEKMSKIINKVILDNVHLKRQNDIF